METKKIEGEQIKKQVKFANLNKNNTLEQYKAEIEKGDWRYEDCLVRKKVIVDQKEWYELTNSFLEDNDVWENIGGSNLTKKDKETLENKYNIKNDKYYTWEEEAQKFFKDKCKAEVVELTKKGTGETIWINTEGFSYARYVGVA